MKRQEIIIKARNNGRQVSLFVTPEKIDSLNKVGFFDCYCEPAALAQYLSKHHSAKVRRAFVSYELVSADVRNN